MDWHSLVESKPIEGRKVIFTTEPNKEYNIYLSGIIFHPQDIILYYWKYRTNERAYD